MSRLSLAGARAWYIVILLSLLYALSFIDRYILALVAHPISLELGVSDAELGLLVGTGFAVLYAVAGIPIASWIDRGDRRLIVALGTAVWSLATIASAFAHSFEVLILCRAGVAMSLVADLFEREKRALPISVYASIGAFMNTGALVAGAFALNIAQTMAGQGGMEPWRSTMILVGMPGLVLALVLVLTVREPQRVGSVEMKQKRAEQSVDFSAFMRFLRENWRFFLPYYASIGISALFPMAKITWLPTIASRGFDMSMVSAGYLIGTTGVVAALVGSFLWSWISARLTKVGRPDAILIAFIIAMSVSLPMIALPVFSGSALVVILGYSLTSLPFASKAALAPLAMQTYGPSRMRARLMAVSLTFSSLVGLGLGPLLAALLAGFWEGDPRALNYGLAVLGLTSIPISILCLELSRRAILRTPELCQK